MPKGRGKLRNRSTRQVVDLLLHHGFRLDKPGPHERYVDDSSGTPRYVIVPAKREAIAPKTLLSILEQAGISKEEARAFWGRPRKR
jgi:predicted RNA binding protein YcfA (HicA-like mRNA interferase family)